MLASEHFHQEGQRDFETGSYKVFKGILKGLVKNFFGFGIKGRIFF